MRSFVRVVALLGLCGVAWPGASAAEGTPNKSVFTCSNCGREVPGDAKLCPYCGTLFAEEKEEFIPSADLLNLPTAEAVKASDTGAAAAGSTAAAATPGVAPAAPAAPPPPSVPQVPDVPQVPAGIETPQGPSGLLESLTATHKIGLFCLALAAMYWVFFK